MSDNPSSNFVWNGGAGDFDDPNQWYDLTAESTGTLAPGANDTIFLGVVTQDDNQFGAPSGVINGGGSAAGAQTLGDGGDTFTLNVNLTLGAGGFSNNDTIDVTGGDIEDAAQWQNFNAVLTVSAGVLNAVTFINQHDALGRSVTTVTGGTLEAEQIENVSTIIVDGGSVSAGTITNNAGLTMSSGAISVLGSFVSQGGFAMTGGNLSAQDITTGGPFTVDGGSVTIEDALTINSAQFTVDGASASVDVTGDVHLGADVGTLTVGDGATMSVGGDLIAAAEAASNATITLDGAGTKLAVTGSVVVGGMGQATLTVQNGALLDAPPDLDIAPDPPPEGVTPVIDPVTGFHTNNIQLVNVTDATIDAGSIDDGDAGYGQITTDGGTVNALDDVTLGDQANAEGQILLHGDNAELDTGDLTVGKDGKGLLTVGNGNTVNTNGDATLADGIGSLGTMTLGDGTGVPTDQASWSISGGLTVGGSGKATLLTNIASLAVSGDSFVIGDAKGSNGLVTMNASTLSYSGEIVIGNAGNGELLFQLGSSVDAGNAIKAPGFTVGAMMGGVGKLIVSGTGTVLNATTLEVGAFGKGSLQVTQGATLQASGAVDVATQEEGVVDAATVSTGGYLGVATDLTVGSLGVATLQVLSGGQVADAGNVTIGDTKGSSAVVTVSGTITTDKAVIPSSLGFGNVLTVGHDGIGTLLVESGGLVGPLSNGVGTIEIGAATDGQGTVTVSGTGSLLRATHIDVGGTDSGAGGAAVLTVKTGGTVEAAQLTVWTTGAVKLAGGAVQTDPLTISGGDLSGEGTVGGDLTDDGTVTAMGGVLTLSGNASGSGKLSIDDGGTLALAGTDSGIDVQFVAGGSSEVLSLPTTSHLVANITDFIAGDNVEVANLKDATSAYSTNGITTTLTFTSGQTDLGQLTFAGDYTEQQLAFDPASGSVTTTVPCFAAGTSILTARGQVPVEDLVLGEDVMTISGRLRPIRWIGRRRVLCRSHAKPDTVQPIRIAKHAFGPRQPHRDLLLSPDHAVFAAGVLIPIKHLVNGSMVARIDSDEVTYYHIELPGHDVVLAENLPVETYLDTGDRWTFAHGGATPQSPGTVRTCLIWEAASYAPLVVAGPQLNAVRRSLRLQSAKRRTPDRTTDGSPARRLEGSPLH